MQAHCRAYAARRTADEQLFRVTQRRHRSACGAWPSGVKQPTPARIASIAAGAIEALRQLGPGEALPLRALGRQIKDGFSDNDMPWLRALVDGLARDGLLALEDDQARLP